MLSCRVKFFSVRLKLTISKSKTEIIVSPVNIVLLRKTFRYAPVNLNKITKIGKAFGFVKKTNLQLFVIREFQSFDKIKKLCASNLFISILKKISFRINVEFFRSILKS